MKRNTIKWRIFKYNINLIIFLIILTTLTFNVAIRLYIEKDIVSQLNKIASNAEYTALQHGPDFFPKPEQTPPPDSPNKKLPPTSLNDNSDPFKYYFMLDRSLKDPLTLLNANFVLLDKNKNIVTPFPDKSSSSSNNFINKLLSKFDYSKNTNDETYLEFNLSGTKYISVIKSVSDKNSFGLGWIIIYSNIEKINQLKIYINIILFLILIISALITIIFSSRISKKISEPLSHLNEYINTISERNFGNKIEIPVYDEFHDFVNNISTMSKKLDTYDKAQKTFLENISHEFRTPLMSIQSYAEGIKYNVIDNDSAVTIIVSEVKRMTTLVEDLLYLSRLDAIEENYTYSNLNLNELVNECVNLISLIALKSNINIETNIINKKVQVYGDKEKLSRALINIISNCVRYANNVVKIALKVIDNNRVQIAISDDGPGFDFNELPYIFERFHKGTKGKFGLGLSISKTIIENLNGKITAKNSNSGAIFIIDLPVYNNIN